MSSYPPPQPGYGPPPPGFRPPRRPGNANGVIAAVVAGTVIVVGVVTSVLLVTGDGNKQPVAASGSAADLPTASRRPTGPPAGSSVRSGYPTAGARTGYPGTSSIATSELSGATAVGTRYFADLDGNLYYSSRGQWCDQSSFPLTEADVDAVTDGYGLGPAAGSGSGASMQGHIGLADGRSGTLTIQLTQSAGRWCISAQSSLATS